MLGVAILNPVPALLPTERLSAFESCSEEGGIAWLKTTKLLSFSSRKYSVNVIVTMWEYLTEKKWCICSLEVF